MESGGGHYMETIILRILLILLEIENYERTGIRVRVRVRVKVKVRGSGSGLGFGVRVWPSGTDDELLGTVMDGFPVPIDFPCCYP